MSIEKLVGCITLVAMLLMTAVSQGAEGPPPGGPTSPPQEAAAEKPEADKTPPAPPYAALLKDAKTYSGMLTMYQKGSNLFVELGGADYGQEYIVLIAIARGIGQTPLLGGFSLSDGDDWVWTFSKVDDRVHLIRKNVRFRATKGFPEYAAVQNAYTDSVLFGLRIVGKGPKGGDLVDFTPVFMSDLPQIGAMLPGFGFAPDKSNWASIKAFERNVELEVAATYASGGRLDAGHRGRFAGCNDQCPLLDQPPAKHADISPGWRMIGSATS